MKIKLLRIKNLVRLDKNNYCSYKVGNLFYILDQQMYVSNILLDLKKGSNQDTPSAQLDRK